MLRDFVHRKWPRVVRRYTLSWAMASGLAVWSRGLGSKGLEDWGQGNVGQRHVDGHMGLDFSNTFRKHPAH